jgi:hypothetical protein
VVPGIAPAYGDDVRKVITLGSMWRGVPLVNYLNEALFPPTGARVVFGDAPVTWEVEWLSWLRGDRVRNLRDIATKASFVRTDVPSMEVMAVNSPWMRQLVFGSPDPDAASAEARPFLPHVAYGSVAGDDNSYLRAFAGSLEREVLRAVCDSFDVHRVLDCVQRPSWFPYLALEERGDSDRNYSDGLVPVWSAAIPGSHQVVSSTHRDFARSPETREYVVRWLNHAGLPRGASLNALWDTAVQSRPGRSGIKTWTFRPGEMAPPVQNAVYRQIGGVGRIHPDALREAETAVLETVSATAITVRWTTATESDSKVNLYQYLPYGNGYRWTKIRDVFVPAPTRDHRVSVTGLRRNTLYAYDVESRVDRSPDGFLIVRSEARRFYTPR